MVEAEASSIVDFEVRKVIKARFEQMTFNNALPVAMNIFYELRDERKLLCFSPELSRDEVWDAIRLFGQVILDIYRGQDCDDSKIDDKINLLDQRITTPDQIGILKALTYLNKF